MKKQRNIKQLDSLISRILIAAALIIRILAWYANQSAINQSEIISRHTQHTGKYTGDKMPVLNYEL